MKNDTWRCRAHLFPFLICLAPSLYAQDAPHTTQLANGKLLAEVPGHPRQVNNLPTAVALSPDGRYAVLLHSGFGSYTSDRKQSLSVLNLETNELSDFTDDRLAHEARQTYFIGLAFSLDGKRIFASMASLTDPLGKKKGNTGNGIAVYTFENGRVAPERFLPLPPRSKLPAGKTRRPEHEDVTYPAGLSVGKSGGGERLLGAGHGFHESLLLHTTKGKKIHPLPLSPFIRIPPPLPSTPLITND